MKLHERFSHTWLGPPKTSDAPNINDKIAMKICFISSESRSMFILVLKSIYMLITWQHLIILFPIQDKCSSLQYYMPHIPCACVLYNNHKKIGLIADIFELYAAQLALYWWVKQFCRRAAWLEHQLLAHGSNSKSVNINPGLRFYFN